MDGFPFTNVRDIEEFCADPRCTSQIAAGIGAVSVATQRLRPEVFEQVENEAMAVMDALGDDIEGVPDAELVAQMLTEITALPPVTAGLVSGRLLAMMIEGGVPAAQTFYSEAGKLLSAA